jgi:hypothetical protein
MYAVFEKKGLEPAFIEIVVACDLPFHPDALDASMTLVYIKFEGIAKTKDHIKAIPSYLFFMVQGKRERSKPTGKRRGIEPDEGNSGYPDPLCAEYEHVMPSFREHRG